MTSEIEEMPRVIDVSVKRTGDTFDVFVAMENLDFAPFEAVLKKELALYEKYPQYAFNFDIDSVEPEAALLTNAA
jgi:hypothetical protein